MSAAGGARSGSAAGPVQQGLKEALIETLTAILSPVQEVRAAAEEQVKVLEVTEGERRFDGVTGGPLTPRCPHSPTHSPTHSLTAGASSEAATVCRSVSVLTLGRLRSS